MSSSNNAAPNDTVINVENDATISIPNQSTVPQENRQATQTANNLSGGGGGGEDMVLAFIVMLICSFFIGTYNIFPILFPIFISSLFMAICGKYYFLLPFMLIVAWNTVYAILCVIFFISFYAGGKEFFLNNALYFCWAEKAEIFKKIGVNWKTFVFHLVFTLIEILIGILMLYVAKLRYAELQKKYEEEMRRVYGEQSVKSYRESLQQSGLIIVSNEQFQAAQDLSSERTNSYPELLAQIPPPPHYQSISILSLPQTPLNGTPPPTYSMLEREQLHLDSLHDASQQSTNNQFLSDTTQTSSNDTTFYSLSPSKNNASTASMSPSSSIF